MTSAAGRQDPIAIVGFACRFPGAPDAGAFWRLLRDGQSGVTEVPETRWNARALYDPDLATPGAVSSRWGGFLTGLEEFDAAFFGVSAGEASAMDPQHRLLLEVTWEAIENAGHAPRSLAGSRAGVFIGIAGDDSDRAHLAAGLQPTAYHVSGHLLSYAANRISRALDLRGPSMILDTGCSAALTAMHLACRSLERGESSLAIVGGANVLLSPYSTVALSQAWMLSPSGRCAAFDAEADGFVRGEGCGVIVLKRLADAIADGDAIRAVIRGTGISQDGRGGNLTAPSADAQAALMRETLSAAGLNARDVSYIEGHGVGTALGDAAEAKALSAVFGDPSSPAAVGSVKANVGHLESASAMAALIKVLLCLEHGVLVPQLHFRHRRPELAPSLDVPTELRDWPADADGSRIAAINSFGLGGANAHALIQAPPIPVARREHGRASQLFPLSARTDGALRTLARRIAEFVRSAVSPELDLADICFTAAVGRDHFPCRAAVVCSSLDELSDALERVAVSGSSTIVASPEATLEKAAAVYVAGESTDWRDIFAGSTPRRVPLPTYPFERRRYWPDFEPATPRPVPTSNARSVFAASLDLLSADERLPRILEVVLEETQGVLGQTGLEQSSGKAFADLGLSSLGAVELRRRLQELTGVPLSAAIAFDQPTPSHVGRYLHDALFATGSLPVSIAPSAAPAGDDEIAIVGAGLRMPGGVVDLDSLWSMLSEGRDAVRLIPNDRWNADAFYDANPDAPGRSYCRHAAFVDDADAFDADFFGIRPVEAKAIDPQHRLLLETAWASLEDAGIVPGSLRESATGVFVGIGRSDFDEQGAGRQGGDAGAYRATGVLPAFAAGRLAYTFGFQGPALAVDTTCSSSLVALHLAVQALRRGECRVALAAGVQIMSSPDTFVTLAKTRALAPDGRSKTFSALGDGYGRGEGAIVLTLERLIDARAAGRRVLGVVRGIAVNHDGPSSGITAPNGSSQRAVLRAALADARLTPRDVNVIECHGTGTVLGDPIEIEALAAVYGEGRPIERPLHIGAIKTNVGHMESAAGLAGVAKVLASFRHGALPPTLFTTPRNPYIAWDSLPIRVVDERLPWPPEPTRRAAVSSFGMSGTNAHVVLEESPESASPSQPAAHVIDLPILLSGRTSAALRANAARLADHLTTRPDLRIADVAHTLATSRTHFAVRAALPAPENGEVASLIESLRSLSLAGGAPENPKGKLALLFTGQGAQRPQMGRSLAETVPSFRAHFDDVLRAFAPHVPRLREALFAPAGSSDAALLDETAYTQPALFALEVALFRTIAEWGVAPDYLMGHSIGEIAAAHVAGVFSLEEACLLVATRGRLMQALPRGGAMVSVNAAEAVVLEAIADCAARVSVAAVNAPDATVIAGGDDACLEVVRRLEASGHLATRLTVSHAFHSHRMDDMLDAFRAVAERLSYSPPSMPIISNVTGERIEADLITSPGYWVRHVRQAVRFADGVAALERAGVTTFLELGPQGVLSSLGARCVSQTLADSDAFIAALRRRGSESVALFDALAALHVRGHDLDWRGPAAFAGGTSIDLPTYAFQRERYPIAAVRGARPAVASATYAGHREDLPDGSIISRIEFGPGAQHELRDHRVYGRILVAGAAQLSVLIAVAESIQPGTTVALTDVEFVSALTFDDENDVTELVVHLRPDSEASGRYAATTSSRDGKRWRVHATATVSYPQGVAAIPRATDATNEGPIPDTTALMRRMEDLAVEWRPRWRWIESVERLSAGVATARLGVPSGVDASTAPLHGAAIDSGLALGSWLDADGARDGVPRLPFSAAQVTWFGRRAVPTRVEHVLRQTANDGQTLVSDIWYLDETGAVIARIDGFTARRAPADRLLPARDVADLYTMEWKPLTNPVAGERLRRVAVVGGEHRQQQLRDAFGGAVTWHDSIEGIADVVGLGAIVALVPHASDVQCASALEATNSSLTLIQQWLRSDALSQLPLIVVTAGAVATRKDERVDSIGGGAVWGLGRSTRTEQADRTLVLVDVDDSAASWNTLPAVTAMSEPQLALRDGAAFVPRLASARDAATAPATSPFAVGDGTVLVTGGTGGIGAVLARHLVRNHGVRSLLLVSRQGPAAPGAAALRADTEAAGARVDIVACDISDRDAVRRMLAGIETDRPLRAIVHTAGVVDDGAIEALTPSRMARVFAPKVDGAIHLHELTVEREDDIAAFVMFSSVAGTFGTAGQGNYSAANTALDALAAHRRARGLAAQSIAWGAWTEVGMAAALDDAQRSLLERLGLRLLPPADGLRLFDVAVGRSEALVAAARLDLELLRRSATPHSVVLEALVPRRTSASTTNGGPSATLLSSLAQKDAAARERVLIEMVREAAREVLGRGPESAFDDRATFQESGLDSIAAVELRWRLHQRTGLRLPATLLFDHPTPATLAAFLLENLPLDAAFMPPAATVAHLDSALVRSAQRAASQSEEWMVLLHELAPGGIRYNQFAGLRWRGSFNRDAFHRAIDDLVARHDVLRTTYRSIGGAITAEVKDVRIDVPLEDLSSLATEERAAAMAALEHRIASSPFVLAEGPLFRAVIAREAPDHNVVLFGVHHVVADGWSMGLIARDLLALYEAHDRGKTASLPALPWRFPDFVAWERDRHSDRERQQHLDFWTTRLSGVPALQLPVDRNPPVRTEQGDVVRFELSALVARALHGLAQERGVTLYTVLATAFVSMLHRYGSQDDFAIGTIVAGRRAPEVRDLVGCFVNAVALRCDVSGDPTVSELLGRMSETIRETLLHDDVPFHEVVRALARERAAGDPLVRTSFVFENIPVPSRDPETGWEMITHTVSADVPGTAKFDLSLSMAESDGRLRGDLIFSTDLFERSTAERMVGHFQTLLEAFAGDVGGRISALPLLTEAERRLVLDDFNDTARPRPEPLALHRLIEEQVARIPHAIALRHSDERMTYAELDARANRLARRLAAFGLVADARVGVCIDRSIDMVIALVAVLKAGAAYVPLDPAYPSERLRFMLEDSACALVLVTGESASALPPDIAVPRLDIHDPSVGAQAASAPGGRVDPRALAYLIYTSGSTGRPKAVAIEHASAVELVRWAHETYRPEDLSCVLASTSICFDLSVFEMFVPLTAGGTAVIVRDALELPTLSADVGITLVNTVPSAAAELVRTRGIPPSVAVVNLAGEPLKPALVDAIYDTTSVRDVFDLYGPSEDTTYSTFTRRERGGPETIGRPLANTRTYVLDRARQPVPIGIAGELFIAGAGLARGYLERPELTAEHFVEDPFHPGERMYRTGDLARWRADGRLEFLGRADQQIKLRGYRIELSEIEAALRELPTIGDAAAAVRDMAGDPRLVAFLVADPNASRPSAFDLRAQLSRALPGFMIPQHVEWLDALPRTRNGKLDRRALATTPMLQSVDAAQPFDPPRPGIESTIATVWREALGVSSIARDSHFFELGGHSLLATRVAASLAERLNCTVPPVVLFEAPVLRTLAERLGPSTAATHADAVALREQAAAQQQAIRQFGRALGARPAPKATEP